MRKSMPVALIRFSTLDHTRRWRRRRGRDLRRQVVTLIGVENGKSLQEGNGLGNCLVRCSAVQWRMAAVTRPQNITFAEMRDMGVRGLLIYCFDYHCSHSNAISADRWPDDVRLSVLEPRFVCKACAKRGADVRPDFHWNTPPVAAMGYR